MINYIKTFLYGRYGNDELNKLLTKLIVVYIVVNLFVRSRIITVIEVLLLAFVLYRALSKNTYKRVKENRIYLEFKSLVLEYLKNIKRNYKSKTHVYRICPHCKETVKMKLPKKIGMKHTTCPTCKKRFAFIVLRRKK